ncbi:hypothetical protein ACFWPK_03090 [Nocardia sp. NPDC058519]|uniref:hypothetical protein n=1 Tax=Nocardia sp. NPDC058519 TaxID=3346535 RepID=UPI0036683913
MIVGQGRPSQLVADGSRAIGLAPVGAGLGVRFDGLWSWLCWVHADGLTVARTSQGPPRPSALAARGGLPVELTRDAAVSGEVLGLTTSGIWQFGSPESRLVRVIRPEPDRPVTVGPGATVLVVGYPAESLSPERIAWYRSAIDAGDRPVVSVLDASRPDRDNELAFVLDGHHALAAYLAAGQEPVLRWLSCEPIAAEAWCWHPSGRPETGCYCDDGDWSDCVWADPLAIGSADLAEALRAQPRTELLARPIFAALAARENLSSHEVGELVEVSEGMGLIEVLGSREARCGLLRLHGRSAIGAAIVNRGTLFQLFARLSPEVRPAGIEALGDWLAAPELDHDYGGSPYPTRVLLDRLDPVLRLLTPGCYEVAIRTDRTLSANDVDLPADPLWPWPPGTVQTVYGANGSTLIPTGTWPPPDAERVAWYRDVMAAGGKPLAVVLAPGPAGSGTGTVARFLLDGHHKVAAGATAFIEIAPVHGSLVDEEFQAVLADPGYSLRPEDF